MQAQHGVFGIVKQTLCCEESRYIRWVVLALLYLRYPFQDRYPGWLSDGATFHGSIYDMVVFTGRGVFSST